MEFSTYFREQIIKSLIVERLQNVLSLKKDQNIEDVSTIEH